MAQGVLFFVGFFCVVLSGSVGSCVQHSAQEGIPERALAGNLISKDSDFIAQTGLKRSLAWRKDQNEWKIRAGDNLSNGDSQRKVLRRAKRRWSPLPFNIIENDRPPFPKDVEIVASDSSANFSVYYRLSGPGVTEPPMSLFSVSSDTGMLRVHRAVDREVHPQFIFIARVFDRRTNKETDLPLPITVNVNDVNDNAPEFTGSLQMSVLERASAGTEVGKLNATDPDEEGTPHTEIQFKLLTGADLFLINSQTGVITTRTDTLDREVQDKHLVTVQIKDMNGENSGLSRTGTATILLKDINDNPPTFRETAYKAKVEENKADILVLRIPVDDKDLEGTPNWNAVYSITKGNEKGNFRIETDPKTNEGLLYVVKPLDHEAGSDLKLEVSARNQAELVGTTATWASIPVDLTVVDQDEGPQFSVPILHLRVKEDVANGTLIGTYTALDPETKSSKGIKYYKVSDPASWINVDEVTGGLRTASSVDRESPFVTGSVYNMTVKAVDQSSKTGTGTVLIQIEDVNDNAPSIPAREMIVCEKEGKMGSVLVLAEDHDQHPFSGPFTFELGDGHDGKWRLKDMNGTSVVVEQAQDLPTGLYSVPLLVKDLQSFGKVQTLTVRICQCRGEECLAKQSSVSLGVWAVLAMLLGLALLLLLCIFCAMACSTQGDKIYIDDASTGILLKSNTEAPGEEVNSNIVIVPSTAVDGSVKMGYSKRQEALNSGSLRSQQRMQPGMQQGMQQQGMQQQGIQQQGIQQGMQQQGMQESMQQSMQQGLYQTVGRDFSMTDGQNLYSSGQHNLGGYVEGGLLQFSEFSSLETWKTNGLYLGKKLTSFLTEDEEFAEDLLQTYGYEGEGSPAGSVGCCSEQGEDNDLRFLDTLGHKFKPLADICTEE